MDDSAFHISKTEVSTGVAVGELFVVEAEGVKDGGVEITHVDAVLNGYAANFVSGAVAYAGLDAASGKENGETSGVVIAAVLALGERGASEFAAPPD